MRALWIYLRAVMPAQLRRSPEETRSSFQRVIGRNHDSKEVEALEKIIAVRRRLQGSRQEVTLRDFGAGSGKSPQRTVGLIHRTSAVPHWWGVFLFRLVRELKPGNVLELGANLGVSGAYIRSALDLNGGWNRFTTIEGDPVLASIARETIGSVSIGRSEVVNGRFQDVLQQVLKQNEGIDLVFIDGHHEYEPTLDYFAQIEPYLSAKALVVFDDVYLWSRAVRKAWKEIVRTHPAAVSIDLAKFGILFRH